MTNFSFSKIEIRRMADPSPYTLESALSRRDPGALIVRIGVMGDPARVDRAELLSAVDRVRGIGLAVLSYTHFWREPIAAGLERTCLASCEDIDEADEAVERGWIPTVILPWDHLAEVGKTFRLPSGKKGVVCPAQTRKGVTCNSCRMCDATHPVWDAGKIAAIGFLDHSKGARRAALRWERGRQLPMFGRETRDVRTPGRGKVCGAANFGTGEGAPPSPGETPASDPRPPETAPRSLCTVCERPIEPPKNANGQRRLYCGDRCRTRAADCARRGVEPTPIERVIFCLVCSRPLLGATRDGSIGTRRGRPRKFCGPPCRIRAGIRARAGLPVADPVEARAGEGPPAPRA